MIFIPNRYTRIYYSIVERAQQRSLPESVYTETHHIIPKSLGGSNNFDNLVKLTFKEHRVCHKLLVKMTEGVSKSKMAYAILFFRVSENVKQSLAESLSDPSTKTIMVPPVPSEPSVDDPAAAPNS